MSNEIVEIAYNDRPIHEKLKALQAFLEIQDQAEVPSHFIQGGGVAVKTILLRKNTVAIGAMHRYASMNIMSRGDVLILTDGAPIRYKVEEGGSPVIIVSPPGTMRAGVIIEDTYWSTIVPSEDKELALVEQKFIVPEGEQEKFLLDLIAAKQIEGNTP